MIQHQKLFAEVELNLDDERLHLVAVILRDRSIAIARQEMKVARQLEALFGIAPESIKTGERDSKTGS